MHPKNDDVNDDNSDAAQENMDDEEDRKWRLRIFSAISIPYTGNLFT
jgi:hypothetical protein